MKREGEVEGMPVRGKGARFLALPARVFFGGGRDPTKLTGLQSMYLPHTWAPLFS